MALLDRHEWLGTILGLLCGLDWGLPLGLLSSQIRKPKLDFDAQAFDAQGTFLAPVMDGTVSLKILNSNPKIS